MALFWIIWFFVNLGLTAWDADRTVHHGVSPAWMVISAGCTLWSAFMVYLTLDD